MIRWRAPPHCSTPPSSPSPRPRFPTPLPSLIHQDMKAPLSHYFIYTSHNTYLTGNQLSSKSSDAPIIAALRRGVRAVELDLWPNATKDGVDVLHGGTWTRPVGLIRCLKSIRAHAFVASPYPVIITLEDHLTPDLQAKVAKMMDETFGEMLFVPDSEYIEQLPSPEELKKRIIISTKPPKEYLETKVTEEGEHQLQKGAEEGGWGAEIAPHKHEISSVSELEHEPSEQYHEDEDMEEIEQRAHDEYKRLIAISTRKRKGGLSDALKIGSDKVERLSLSEQTFEKAAISHGAEITRFTQRHLLRIYPRGMRITSSNYNPMHSWMYGAQMVALNMQGHGRQLWMMHGMFRANGGCGYVKKPDFLLNNDPDHIFSPRSKQPVMKTLKIRVFMGDGWRFDFRRTYFDLLSPPDFYARVGIAGVPADTVMKTTRTIKDNWTPMWDQEFEFPLTVPELALLRVEVHEHDVADKDDFAGQTCLPVWELQQGIRAVRLCNKKGELLLSVRLLMHFQLV